MNNKIPKNHVKKKRKSIKNVHIALKIKIKLVNVNVLKKRNNVNRKWKHVNVNVLNKKNEYIYICIRL